jgi:hypothetical protein
LAVFVLRCGQVICVKFGHDARITELRNRQRDIKDELKELDAEKLNCRAMGIYDYPSLVRGSATPIPVRKFLDHPLGERSPSVQWHRHTSLSSLRPVMAEE